MVDYSKPIPKVEFPSIHNFDIIGLDEPIVSISDNGIRVCSKYNEVGVPGSYKDCYARETVVKMLVEARKRLPEGYDLKVFDGYRPICIQHRLWNMYRRQVINSNPELSDEEIDFKTSFYVSKPSCDINQPSLHNTGGAIDLTLTDSSGRELNMGTDFDDFSNAAWTNHFELYEENEEVRDNRRILYNVMTSVGFTNLPSEWWHYGYGTKFWAYFTGNTALYKGILDIDFPNRFPIL